jgi:tetrahydromethanopterin S-methyltransferase subunit E
MSDFSSLGIGLLFSGFIIAGFILLFNGVVQLRVRNKSGPWKEGGVSLLAGAIIAGVSVWEEWGSWIGIYLGFLLAGLALAVNGVVKICVRKKTGLWKEGLATLLAGAIIAVLPILFVPLLGLLLWY